MDILAAFGGVLGLKLYITIHMILMVIITLAVINIKS